MARRLLVLSLGLLLLSAAAAALAAYDPWLAARRFGLMGLGVGGLLALRGLGRRRPVFLLAATALLAATLSGLALAFPHGLSPTFPGDIFGALLAALTPALLAAVALTGRGWRTGALAVLALALAGLARTAEAPALAALGLVLVGSCLLFIRWPWKALGVPLLLLAAAVAGLWWLENMPGGASVIPNLVLLAAAVAGLWWPGLVGALEGRLEVARQAFLLAGDFSLTGGGLGAFPGLYAWYIQGVPFLYLDQAHNLYANIAVEQGVVGLAALLGLLLAALWQGWRGLR